MAEINTEEIMKEIRDNIEKRGYSEDVLEFEDVAEAVAPDDTRDMDEEYSIRQLRNWVQMVRETCRVRPVQNYGNKFKYIVKRILRKLKSIFGFRKHMQAFSLNTAKSLNQLEKYVEIAESRNPVSEAKVLSDKELRQFYENTEELIERLENRVAFLEAEVSRLKGENDDK